MKLLYSVTLALGLALSLNNLACEQPINVRIGVVPWTSADLSQVWAKELTAHLKKYCVHPQFSSANNFKHFIEKAVGNQFDMIDVPPHIGSYLMKHHGFKAVSLEDWKADFLIISQVSDKVQTLADLKGETAILPDPLSLVSMISAPILKAQGIIIEHTSSNSDVLSKIMRGKYSTGAIISPLLNSLTSIVSHKLSVIHTIKHESPGLLLSRDQFKPEHDKAILSALKEFDYGNKKLWQKWLPTTPERISDIHAHQQPYVKQLEALEY